MFTTRQYVLSEDIMTYEVLYSYVDASLVCLGTLGCTVQAQAGMGPSCARLDEATWD